MGNKTFDLSSKKKDFCPKTTKFGPKLAFLVNLGQGMHLVPCWCVGWWLWRAGCISQDTYLLYNIVLLVERQNVFPKTAEIVVVDEYNITADNNAWYNKVGDNSDDLITDEHL